MSAHYTDAEVNAVHDFAWRNRDGIAGSGSQNGARELLDRIAPAIAARALREFAARMEGADWTHRDDWGVKCAYAFEVTSAADEIEHTP